MLQKAFVFPEMSFANGNRVVQSYNRYNGKGQSLQKKQQLDPGLVFVYTNIPRGTRNSFDHQNDVHQHCQGNMVDI